MQEHDSSPTASELLHFWCEWECEAELVHQFPPTDELGYPQYLLRPSFRPKKKQELSHLHNTDPFVFGGPFRYCVCHQGKRPSLQHLAPGTVIAFGSHLGGDFVLDTVFVVARAEWYDRSNYERLKLPHLYRDAAIGPVVLGASCSSGERFRLYEGATMDHRINGMFSFFPCLRAEESLKLNGFPRPGLRAVGALNRRINPKLKQGIKTNGVPLPIRDAAEVWRSIVDQVIASQLALGVYSEMPQRLPAH